MALLERFFPDIYVKSVFELPLEDLEKAGHPRSGVRY